MIGTFQTLRASRSTLHGWYLDAGEHGEILLPRTEIPTDLRLNSEVEVYIYRDSEERIIATTQRAKASVGEIVALEVVGFQPRLGAFLALGTPRDLLLPLKEMRDELHLGDAVVVALYLDRDDRLRATQYLNQYVAQEPAPLHPGQAVSGMIIRHTRLGYTTLVDGRYPALLAHAPTLPDYRPGDAFQAWVGQPREDGKLCLVAESASGERLHDVGETILAALKEAGGRLPYDDDSPAEDIYRTFAASKKAFKRALGILYRTQRIVLTHPGIALPGLPNKPLQPTKPKLRPGNLPPAGARRMPRFKRGNA